MTHKTQPVRSIVSSILGLALTLSLASPLSAQHSCRGNLVRNPGFTDGNVPGSMPAASVNDWASASGTPQVISSVGCEDLGAIQMWGNQVVGESIYQALSTGFQAGKTYRIKVCIRWLATSNRLLPQYVRFKFRASSSVPAFSSCVSPACEVIGTTPNTSSSAWQTFTLPDWTAPSNLGFLTIQPENDHAINDGNLVSWGQIDNLCIQEVPGCAPGSLVSNGDFTDGLVAGSMPSGSVTSWNLLTGSPQVVISDGCADPGSVQMWGNQVVGESIRQQLPGAGIEAGKTYRVKVCYRWLQTSNPVLPRHVRFRLCATNALGSYPSTSSYDVIGTTPNTSSSTWQTYVFPDWVAPNNAAYLTVNPENDHAVNHGDFVSWGRIDDICIQEVDPCPGNVVSNGGFALGNVPGSMPSASVDDWTRSTGTPQVVSAMGCDDPGLIQMWGNQVVGESIQQTVTFKKNHTYRISLCYRWIPTSNPVLPMYVRFKLRASNGSVAFGSCATATCDVIGITPTTSSNAWLKVTLPDWVAPKNFDTLTINPENDSTMNHPDFVSWGQIDNVCIRDISPCKWIHVATGVGGAAGIPTITGGGCIRAHDFASVVVGNGTSSGLAILVLGLSELSLPIFGGTLVPAPDLTFPLLLDGTGTAAFGVSIPPSVFPGVEFCFQALLPDPTAPANLAFTRGLFTVSG